MNYNKTCHKFLLHEMSKCCVGFSGMDGACTGDADEGLSDRGGGRSQKLEPKQYFACIEGQLLHVSYCGCWTSKIEHHG